MNHTTVMTSHIRETDLSYKPVYTQVNDLIDYKLGSRVENQLFALILEQNIWSDFVASSETNEGVARTEPVRREAIGI